MANKISNHFPNETKEYIPWSYKMNYHQTKKIWNSKDLSARIIKGSGIGIAALAIAETFYEIALMHLKFIGNVFHLYEKNIFKKHANYKIIETDLPIEQKKPSIIKRIFFISLKLSTAGALGYSSYRLLKYFNYIPKDISILNEAKTHFLNILTKIKKSDVFKIPSKIFANSGASNNPQGNLLFDPEMCPAPTNDQCFWDESHEATLAPHVTEIAFDNNSLSNNGTCQAQ